MEKTVHFFVFILVLPIIQGIFPKIVWIYWDGNQPLTTTRTIFVDNLKQHVQNQQGWTLNFLNDQNYREFLPNQIPFQLNKQISGQLKSDIIRLSLLLQYGGMWVDLTTIFLQDFSWIDNILTDANVINRDIRHSYQPDVLMFQWLQYRSRTFYYDVDGNKKRNYPGYESWFILAKPNTPFIAEWKKVFFEYYYSNTQQMFKRMIKNDIYMGLMEYTDYFRVYFSLYEVLQVKQIQLDRKATLTQRINSNVYYKIWTIDCSIGPCIAYFNQRYQTLFRETLITLYSISQKSMLQFYNIPKLRYFTKFVGPKYYQLNGMIMWFNSETIKSKNMTQLFIHKQKQIPSCRDLHYIASDSFIYQRFFQQSSIHLNATKYYTPQQRQQFNIFCQKYEKNQRNYLLQFLEKISFLQGCQYISILIICVAFGYAFFLLIYKIYKETQQRRLQNYSYLLIDYCPIQNIFVKINLQLKRLNISIPYPILAFVYVYPVYRAALLFQQYNQRQMYNEVLGLTFLCLIIHKFSKVHILRSKLIQIWLILFSIAEQLIYLCISKLLCQLVYNRWIHIYSYTFLFGLLLPNLIKGISNTKLKNDDFLKLAFMLKNKHFIILTAILFVVVSGPNLRYIMIKDVYITVWITRMLITYVMYLIIANIYLCFRSLTVLQIIGLKEITQISEKKIVWQIRRLLIYSLVCLSIYWYQYSYRNWIYGKFQNRPMFFASFSLILSASNPFSITIYDQEKNKPIQFIQKYGLNTFTFISMVIFGIVIFGFQPDYTVYRVMFFQKEYFLTILRINALFIILYRVWIVLTKNKV